MCTRTLAVAATLWLTTTFMAAAQQTQLGLQSNPPDPQITGAITQSYTAIGAQNDVINRAATTSANSGAANLSENSWDFTAPGGVPGFEPMRPTDNYPELMTQAVGR
jgi:hypothetical protein